MVDVIGRAKVVVESDVDQASVANSGKSIGSSLKTGALLGVAALGTIAAAGIKAGKAAEEAAAQSRKLGQVLDNMGQGNAQAGVEAYADQLSRVTGIDDEVIKGGQTILATFSEVASSAGTMGGTFERATQLSVDLAAAGFGSVDSAAKMLGKALQDPEKGITALSRAGVTFTAQQKEQIQNFIETGDVAAAQNLILAEVEKQVGKTAEAGATGSERLKTAFGEAEESLGFLLADLFDTGKDKSVVDLAADAVFKFADQVEKFQKSKDWKALKSDIKTFGGDLGVVADAIGSIGSAFDKLSRKFTGRGAVPTIISGLRQMGEQAAPLSKIADAIELIADAIDHLNAKLKGNSGIDINTGQNAEGNRSFRIEDLLASGDRNVRGGWYLVGEEGPELVSLPAGSDVYSNHESRAMVAGASGDTIIQNNAFNLYGPESLSGARRDADFYLKYGTRFGSANLAVAP